MRYGDSTTGTFASGPVAMSTVSIAGVAIDNQMFAAIDDTTNTGTGPARAFPQFRTDIFCGIVVEFGAAGIFGLGFPSES